MLASIPRAAAMVAMNVVVGNWLLGSDIGTTYSKNNRFINGVNNFSV
jgi:hypothetical protein